MKNPAFQGATGRRPSVPTRPAVAPGPQRGEVAEGREAARFETIGDVLRAFKLRNDPEAQALARAVADLSDELAVMP